MFTGIVEAVGEVRGRESQSEGVRLTLGGAPFLETLELGDSVSVAGVCMTVVALAEETFSVDAVETTVSRTTIGDWQVGTQVNLESALKAGEPLGGHLVQGHVDGVGRVQAIETGQESRTLDVALPPEIDAVTVSQGSLTIDGVSLTVAGLSDAVARFAIIPYTWTHTTLGRLQQGGTVNVEADVIGKYVGRAIRAYSTSAEV